MPLPASESSEDQFDLLVLTASNRRQAATFQRAVGRMIESGAFPVRKLLVVPDPGGRRIGSGGATLEAAARAAASLAGRAIVPTIKTLFQGRRVLVVHSGGETRRLPAFSALGKILVPWSRIGPRGGSLTMLEAIVGACISVPGPVDGQFMVVTGDALVQLAGAGVRLDRQGMTGVAQVAPLERGGRHGVYVAGPDGALEDMLQKPTPKIARAAGAVRRGGQVLVDTGVLSFDPASIARWLSTAGVTICAGRVTLEPGLLASVRAGTAGSIELYHEMLKAIPKSVTWRDYEKILGDSLPSSQRKMLKQWRRGVRGIRFHVAVAGSDPFLHPGTTREYIDLVSTQNRSRQGTSLTSDVGDAVIARTSIIESCDLRGAEVRLRGRNLISGVPRARGIRIDLPKGGCLFVLPVRDHRDHRDRPAWLAVAHHEGDDFKTSIAEGGTFGGRMMKGAAIRKRPGPFAIMDAESDATLRSQDLWLIGSAARTIAHALGVLRGEAVSSKGCISLASALERVDHDRLLDFREDLQTKDLERNVVGIFEELPRLTADSIAPLVSVRVARRMAKSLRDAAVDRPPDSTAARLAAAAHGLEPRGGGMQLALSIVGRSVAAPLESSSDRTTAVVLPDQAVWAASPVRIDLAGGWSDTPPICSDLGGVVVNAAVLLHGKQPLQAMAKIIDEPKIVVHSVDLGSSRTFTTTRELLATFDPSDWTTLPRAALRLAGITPVDPQASLRKRLDRLGGRVVLTMYSAVPKGSGLGTSSILGATVLACLDRLVRSELNQDALIDRTSVLEQLMTTRGGWQDQVGGVVGGIKVIRSEPGPVQRPVATPLDPPVEFVKTLEARSVLLYSGEKRLARDILELVLGRYLSRAPEAMRIVAALKSGAEAMADAVRCGDVDAFTERLAEYWRLKTQFHPGSTNRRIDAIAAAHGRDLAAWELPGAGGGGFVMMVAKDEQAARRIEARVDRHPPNRLARRFPLEIDPDGLRVTVL